MPYLLENSKEYGEQAVENGLRVCLYSYSTLGRRIKNDIYYNEYFFGLSEYIRRNFAYKYSVAEKKVIDRKNIIRVGVIGSNDFTNVNYSIEIANAVSDCVGIDCVYYEISFVKNSLSNIKRKLNPNVEYFRLRVDLSKKNICESLNEIKNIIDRDDIDITFEFLSDIWNYLLHSITISPIDIFFNERQHMKISIGGCDWYVTFGTPCLYKQRFCMDYWRVLPFYNSQKSVGRIRKKYEKRKYIIFSVINDLAANTLNMIASILSDCPNVEFWHVNDCNTDCIDDFFKERCLINRTKNIRVQSIDMAILKCDIVIDDGAVNVQSVDMLALEYGKPLVILNSKNNNSIWERDLIPAFNIYQNIERHIYIDDPNINYSFFDNDVIDVMKKVYDNKEFFFICDELGVITECKRLINDKKHYSECVEIQNSIYKVFYENTAKFKGILRQLIDGVLNDYECNAELMQAPLISPEPNSVIAVTAMSRCVNRCIFCLQSVEKFSPVVRVQSANNFKKMLSEISTRTRKIGLTTFAETLEFKSDVLKRVKIAKEHGLMPSFETSNVFWDEFFYTQLLQIGIERILVSINAPTRELYKVVTQRDFFDRIIENTRKLIKLRDEINPNVKIHMHIMMFKEFINDSQQMIDEFKNKVDHIYFQGLCNWGNDKWNNEKYTDFRMTPLKMKRERYPCPSIFDTLVLHPDGNYYICGMAYQQHVIGKEVALLGNSANITIMEAWRRLSYYRQKHLRGEWDKLECCRECNAWLNWILYLDEVVITEDGFIENRG